ncbi:transposase [Desulfococcaceae bacterium HSG8]|nr:transposase [Desulfococcaceae bacterium HSG8]
MNTPIADQANEPVILRKIIPWQEIINGLVPFYDEKDGCRGKSLRTVAGVFIIRKLRGLGDRPVVSRVAENRYIQYFCNVADENVKTFIHHTALCKIRKRFGEEGAAVIGDEIFRSLRLASAIIFSGSLRIFGEKVADLTAPEHEKEKARELLTLLTVFNGQNEQKIAGEKHIKDRIVSLSDPDMRPIKKGKSHPDCESGTTLQLTFNRDGFMINAENFIGNPGDKIIS